MSSSSSSSYDSSSSSSKFELSWDKTLPFSYECYQNNSIWTIVESDGYLYAGTGSDGLILRSRDRVFWEEIVKVSDTHVKSLFIQESSMFIGTAPKGQIYLMDLQENTLEVMMETGSDIVSICYFNDSIYALGGAPCFVYKYNIFTSKWDKVYQTYTAKPKHMFVEGKYLYVVMDGAWLIKYDGRNWILSDYNIQTVKSVKNAVDNVKLGGNYPIDYSSGISSVVFDKTNVLIGTKDYGRIILSSNSSSEIIFDSGVESDVYCMENVGTGVNLASIGNKLYLLYSGNTSSEITTTTTTLKVETVPQPSGTIDVVYPVDNVKFQYGDTMTIQWNSNKSINDAVKIELYQDNKSYYVINAQTSNDGTYDWYIPTSIPQGKYTIVITWLSTNVVKESGKSGTFEIVVVNITTTTSSTTTLTPIQKTFNSYKQDNGLVLLELNSEEYITFIYDDSKMGSFLFATSSGRILSCSKTAVNAYLTGDRTIYAEAFDGFGNMSDIATADVFYGLFNKIIELTSENTEVNSKYVKNATVSKSDIITAEFLSPIIHVKTDFGFWRELIWQETKPENTDIIICVRAANSETLLTGTPWKVCFSSDSVGYNTITKSLDDISSSGSYLQIKVSMSTSAYNVTPILANLGITYSTRQALYFFTTRFYLVKNGPAKNGLITAEITEPQNTEIQFGVTDKDSTDWNDYQLVDVNKLFQLNDFKSIKIGIRMMSHDVNVPQVDQFAILTGAEDITFWNES